MVKMSGSLHRSRLGQLLPVVGFSLAALAWQRPAHACGGFFCSAVNPVNQAAERIVFAKNNDGTVTAMIEIKYQGPSTNFSWLLPISSVPTEKDILLASTAAFDKLQQASNPQYNLTLKVEGTCDEENDKSLRGSTNFNGPTLAAGEDSGPGSVMVDASGIVGAFEWTVISVTDPNTTDPAQVAVDWLKMNGYDVPDGAPGLLGPYLEGGMHLLALKLKKGASTGSIRQQFMTVLHGLL